VTPDELLVERTLDELVQIELALMPLLVDGDPDAVEIANRVLHEQARWYWASFVAAHELGDLG
jgi:hypothetical protein